MRKFEFIKINHSDSNEIQNQNQVFVIRSKHENAKITYIVAEVYDYQLAETLTEFLNQREEEYEKARLDGMVKQ